MLKDLYTLTQRSRIGSLIIDNGVKTALNISNPSNPGAWMEFNLPTREIQAYKANRMAVLQQVPRPTDDTYNIKPVEKPEPNISREESITQRSEPLPAKTETKKTEVESRKTPVTTNPINTSVSENEGQKPESHETTNIAYEPETVQNNEVTTRLNEEETITDVDRQPSGVEVENTEPINKERQIRQRAVISNVELMSNLTQDKNVLALNNDDYTR